MLKRIIIITALFAGITACNSKSKSARDYNNNIIAEERSLQPEEQTIEDNVKKYYDAGQYDSIALAGGHMEEVVQKSIDEIDALPVPKTNGVEIFKAAVIQYFKFFKSIYTIYKEYGLAGTDERRTEIMTELQKLTSQKQEVVNDLQRAQRKYAGDNNFRME